MIEEPQQLPISKMRCLETGLSPVSRPRVPDPGLFRQEAKLTSVGRRLRSARTGIVEALAGGWGLGTGAASLTKLAPVPQFKLDSSQPTQFLPMMRHKYGSGDENIICTYIPFANRVHEGNWLRIFSSKDREESEKPRHIELNGQVCVQASCKDPAGLWVCNFDIEMKQHSICDPEIIKSVDAISDRLQKESSYSRDLYQF
ncbi:hypothetical protein GX51_06182 [Blastomyces parvus]|uniref:Uncharacterized protein n=1 Tax=Blastomyces parvus TaxID=2060905 RepID=A0A2B7WT14_9EURO|nr:hypothetical protein GX51_06182 [Blastomyces parvus]